MKEQVVGKNVCKLVTKRKKAPHKALHMWKYNMMRQKENMFSAPLVHGKLVHDFIFPHGFNYCILVLKQVRSNLALLQECVLT
jgi:hypothetical protein